MRNRTGAGQEGDGVLLNEDELCELFVSFRRDTLAYARARNGGDSSGAEDLVQDACIWIWEHRATVRGGAAGVTRLLRRFIHDRSLNVHRNHRAQCSVDVLDQERACVFGPDAYMDAAEAAGVVRRCVSKLPDSMRRIFWLKWVQLVAGATSVRRCVVTATGILIAIGGARPTDLVARTDDCHEFWDIQDDDWPLPPDIYHAVSGTTAELPNADPIGEEEWGEPYGTGERSGEPHTQWISGPAVQHHNSC
jgi:DNA-directed RNA polymerase specialized sigma24 family protein